jgi:hypothetical protein
MDGWMDGTNVAIRNAKEHGVAELPPKGEKGSKGRER